MCFLIEIEGEKKCQDKWAKSKIFEADPDLNKEKIFLIINYPYTSGPLHIGHGRSYLKKYIGFLVFEKLKKNSNIVKFMRARVF